jgi:hypothetical protein
MFAENLLHVNNYRYGDRVNVSSIYDEPKGVESVLVHINGSENGIIYVLQFLLTYEGKQGR